MGQKEKGTAIAEQLKKILKRCPICKQESFKDHSYLLLATTVIREEERDRVDAFVEALKNHRWSQLHQFQEWEGAYDNLVAYLCRCVQGNIALLTVHDSMELFYSPSLIELEILDLPTIQALEGAIPLQWHPFQ